MQKIIFRILPLLTLSLVLAGIYACRRTEPASNSSLQATRAGIGFLMVKEQAFEANQPIVVYKDPRLSDTLTIIYPKQAHQDSLLQPFYFDTRAGLLYWKSFGWNRKLYTIQTQPDVWAEKAYIRLDTNVFRFVRIKDVLAGAGIIERIDTKKNPIKLSPRQSALTVSWESPSVKTLEVKEVYKQWLRVAHGQQEGWIRWVFHDTLWVKLPDSVWHNPSLWKLSQDPTTDPILHRANQLEQAQAFAE